MKRLFIPTAIALLGFAGMASGAFAQAPDQAPPQQQNPAVIAPQTPDNPSALQPAPEQAPAIIRDQETIIVRGPFQPVNAQMGDIQLALPGPMSADSVYVDGTYVGVAGDISDIQVTPGPHSVKMCAPDGTTEYQHVIGVATNQTSEIMPTEALNNGTNAPSAEYFPPASAANLASPALAPPVPAYVPQPQPASGQGDLRLSEAYALRKDAVFVDGSYIGTARNLRDLELTPGTHEVALRAPDGNTDFVTQVGISLNEVTRLRAYLPRPTLNG